MRSTWPFSGMAADHPDLSFIVKQIAEFVGASAAPGAYGALAEECNVFDIIHRRILKTEGYKSLGAQGQKLKLYAPQTKILEACISGPMTPMSQILNNRTCPRYMFRVRSLMVLFSN